MFGLLKKSYTVEEIHAEVDSAQDRLLADAEKLLNELEIPRESKIESKANMMLAIGFKNSETVAAANALKEARKNTVVLVDNTKDSAELIKYYKQTYPFEKFLTVEELDRICTKYGLIHAPVQNYIKDVPEKNLVEIKNAKWLEGSDLEGDTIKVDYKSNGYNYDNEKRDKVLKLLSYLGVSDGVITQSKALKLVKRYPHYASDRNTYSVDFRNNTWLYKIWVALGSPADMHYDYNQVETTSKSGYFIAAPKSHFNLEGLSKKTKHGFFNVQVTEIKDPIVFQYVRGGMVRVITKWGTPDDQAYLDPALTNEKMN